MDFPPLPSPVVKSPPWHMNFGITRWNVLYLKPNPFSPVQSARKFSAVFGTTSVLNSITIRPTFSPPADISKYTFGNGASADKVLIEKSPYAPTGAANKNEAHVVCVDTPA